MFIPDIFMRCMDAIRYSSNGTEFVVLVDWNYTNSAFEELQIAVDAYDDGHYETLKDAVEISMNAINCAYAAFFKNENEHFGELPKRIWSNFIKEVNIQCPIVKTLAT